MARRKRNLLFFGVDSIRADRMSCYGYERLTTPYIDRMASEGVLFERNYSPHIPTTSGYSAMFTGMDCFSMQVVALRHRGGLTERVSTLAEILRGEGYNTTCVGFTGNPASRGFDEYLNYAGWGKGGEDKLRKAESLNEVTLPELERLAKADKPFCLFLRHMDPHSPYLPPSPYDTLFHSGDPCDPAKTSMAPVMDFKPFCDYFASWMPPGITDAEWVCAQYDSAIAYMDACIQRILTRLDELGLVEDTLVVLNGDHGETLMEHECYFDHHGLYDCTLHVPLILRLPGRLSEGLRVPGYTSHQDLLPTVLDLLGLKTKIRFDGTSLMDLVRGRRATHTPEFYLTEATWMRKHGWRTPEWKLIEALEPDFHFKPEVELYNLIEDPEESVNLARKEPGVVAMLKDRMEAWIARREKETGLPNPMYTNLQWHGKEREGPFPTSEAAYNELHIGSVGTAQRLQARDAKKPNRSKKAKKTRKTRK
ncbi:MAG: sulfatase [Candidatus Latescibacteria bacterium]|jgi:arylsulfatase A-like enzyme|nr:sulfatase [Candidatus Latescibacterota bacterium]